MRSVNRPLSIFFLCFFCFFCIEIVQAGYSSFSPDIDSIPAGAEFKQFFYDNGKVSSEGYFLNGQPEGVWKNYDPHGNLVSAGSRKDLKLTGKWIFYENGHVASEIFYKNDRKNGPSIYYLSDRVVSEYYGNDTLQGIRRATDTAGKLLQTTRFTMGLEDGFDKRYNRYGDVSVFTFFKDGMVVFREAVNNRDKGGRKQGLWKDFYENGILHWECTYRDDLKDGYCKTYDSTGNMLTLQKYMAGVLQEDAPELAELTVHTEYYADGSPKFRVGYKNGKPEGICREYDSITGKIIRGIFFKDGKAVGSGMVDDNGNLRDQWKEYYPDGRIRCIGNYYKGQKYGKWKYFYPDGTLEQEGEFKNGQYDGGWLWYYPDGRIRLEQEYYKGKLDGQSTEYDDSARVIAKGSYTDGLEEGRWEYLHGEERTEGSYQFGERTGLWKSYWTEEGKNKKLSFQGNYSGGLPDGRHQYYNEKGILIEEGYYRMGKRVGTRVRYDKEGFPAIRIRYDDNEEEVKYNGKKTLTEEEEKMYRSEQDIDWNED